MWEMVDLSKKSLLTCAAENLHVSFSNQTWGTPWTSRRNHSGLWFAIHCSIYFQCLPSFTINLSQIYGKNSIHGAFGIPNIDCPKKSLFSFFFFRIRSVNLSLFLENPLEVQNERSEGPWRRRPLPVSSLFSLSRNHTPNKNCVVYG